MFTVSETIVTLLEIIIVPIIVIALAVTVYFAYTYAKISIDERKKDKAYKKHLVHCKKKYEKYNQRTKREILVDLIKIQKTLQKQDSTLKESRKYPSSDNLTATMASLSIEDTLAEEFKKKYGISAPGTSDEIAWEIRYLKTFLQH